MKQPLTKEQLKRNQMIGKTLEKGAERGVMIAADIFKAIVKFIGDMLKIATGK